MKEIEFLGDSLKAISEFPKGARQATGYQLCRLQESKEPNDFKPMPTIGKGVEEIRVWDGSGTFRVFYTARVANTIYVLHAFQKKTRETPDREIEIAKRRYAQLIRGKG